MANNSLSAVAKTATTELPTMKTHCNYGMICDTYPQGV